MKFTFGFIFKKVRYGWHKKALYRLPFKRKYFYGLKKIKPCMVGATKCYNIQRTKLTINRVKQLTKKIKWQVINFHN